MIRSRSGAYIEAYYEDAVAALDAARAEAEEGDRTCRLR
jgi:hypothetical protein